MENAPHILLRVFERLILFPVDACVFVAGLVFLVQRAWLFGAFLLLMSLFLGMGRQVAHSSPMLA